MHGDAGRAEARRRDDDELYAWCDAEEGEDEGGVFEFAGAEVRVM